MNTIYLFVKWSVWSEWFKATAVDHCLKIQNFMSIYVQYKYKQIWCRLLSVLYTKTSSTWPSAQGHPLRCHCFAEGVTYKPPLPVICELNSLETSDPVGQSNVPETSIIESLKTGYDERCCLSMFRLRTSTLLRPYAPKGVQVSTTVIIQISALMDNR